MTYHSIMEVVRIRPFEQVADDKHQATVNRVHAFMRSNVHAFERSCVRTFMRSNVHAFERSCVRAFMRSNAWPHARTRAQARGRAPAPLPARVAMALAPPPKFLTPFSEHHYDIKLLLLGVFSKHVTQKQL